MSPLSSPSHRLLVLLPLVLVVACGPIGPIPGNKLSGPVTEPPTDWSALNAAEVVQLEVAGPYVVNLWGVGLPDGYFVVAGEGRENKWARRIERSPEVRLRIDGKVYELEAEQVLRDSGALAIRNAFDNKYEMDGDGGDFPDAIVFRLHAR